MLAEAKDTSEIMVDLAYAAVYFNDPGMATEVDELEERMNDLVQDMRAVSIMAVRRPAEAEGMASVLQIISAIESIANAAVDVTRIVTHRLGIPNELIADLSNAEEVSHRVWVREGSHMAHRPLKDLEIPVQCGMRVVAVRRDRSPFPGVDHAQVARACPHRRAHRHDRLRLDRPWNAATDRTPFHLRPLAVRGDRS